MKHEYFGDVNDYTKYAILRRFNDTPKIIHWMLTVNEKGKDGRKLAYLKHRRCSSLDSELWNHLGKCVQNENRDVAAIEGMLGNVVKYEKRLIDDWNSRQAISEDVISLAGKNTLVFLDPDNGYEVESTPEGKSKSKKYIYRSELRRLLDKDATVMLFQHSRMGESYNSMITNFSKGWEAEYRFAVKTSHVVYYFLSKSNINWMMERISGIQNGLKHTRLEILKRG